MNNFIFICYEFLTVVIPFIIIFIIQSKKHNHIKTINNKKHFFITFIFSIYISIVFYLTGSGTIFDLYRYGIEIRSSHINLLPFSRNIDRIAYLQNILLFMPFGFLLPLIWSNTYKLKYIFLSSFSFSLLIETSQLFNNRRTDIDDLILNTLGALLGYLFFHLFASDNKRLDYSQYEPIIYISVMFLGHFLLFNEFGLAKLIYNF